MQRKLTRVRTISSECRSNGHRWNAAIFTTSEAAPRSHGQNTLSDTIGTLARHCDAQIPSLPRTFGEGRGKSGRHWNSFRVIPGPGGTKGTYFNANEKVPRQTKSPRSFISREKPEVERCECGWSSCCVDRRSAAKEGASQG